MVIVDIRKQGGAAVITIPSAILKLLCLEIGSQLELDVKNNYLTARPITKSQPKRYSLKELLKGVTEESILALNNETLWAREGYVRGNEIE
ncbi:MAG: hypothetical protein WCK49_03550 [Myxococcaceae bacterium]